MGKIDAVAGQNGRETGFPAPGLAPGVIDIRPPSGSFLEI
ncbi:hypothetical protein ADIS_3152 [Lunatimonas lonarensis]|uniref:Uncharacterized protein n=1 Tax=Lunatimonas lonarensis TaxID=1232681 RepID=R7ZQS5_9BACT|nr:hypothetical protein ADIS_3152 [Lunatimonas lonarensis]